MVRCRDLLVGFIIAVLSLTGWGFAPDVARAQEVPVIGTVDLQFIMAEAKAVASLRVQLDELSAGFQEEITVEENALRELDQELTQQRALVAPDVWEQRRSDFQDRVLALQRQVDSVRRTVDGGRDATLTQIRLVALEEIGRVAEEQGVDIVLSEAQVIVARNVFDLTEDALERLDARLPSVDIAVTETDN